MRGGRLGRLAVAVGLGGSLWGCAPVPAEDVAPRALRTDAVVGGTAAPGEDAVVALVARRVRCTGESLTLLCSGALIAPDVVLTAAHCLEIFGERGAYEVFLGERLLPESRTAGRFVRVTRAVRHPDYDRATHARDVALLRLAVPVEQTPLSLPDPGGDALVPGALVRAVGFGDTRGGEEASGVRRQGTLRVTEVGADVFLAGPAPAMSCVGDSGGPVLARDARGREVLAGVTVSGDFACQREAVQLRVESVRASFLQPFLDAPLEAPGPVLALSSLCAEACTRDADCPAGLACVESDAGGRHCLLDALQAGDYGTPCVEDAACGTGGVCARLEAGGTEACRCFTPCPEPSGAPSRGCTGAPGPLSLGGVLLALGLGRRAARRDAAQ